MAEKQFLMQLVKQLGVYQVSLLLSRMLGIMRDVILLSIVGAGVLPDQIFFLLGLPDIFMSLLVGGGSVLFLNDCYREKNKISSNRDIALSSVAVYVFLALIFILSERLLDAPAGKLFYSDIANDDVLLDSYYLSLYALVFSLAMVAPNSIFLYREKLYLQPLMNTVFTLIVIAATASVYYFDSLSIKSASLIIIIAALGRFFISFTISLRLLKGGVQKITLVKKTYFYKNLILSGASIGVLVLLPFTFRAKLPEFGEGLYASSAILFKLNDLILAFIIIPVTTMMLRKMSGSRIDYRMLGAVFLFSVAAVFVILFVITISDYLDISIPFVSMYRMLANYIAITLVFSSMAYISSMVLVKKGLHLLSSISATLALAYMIFSQNNMNDRLETYFYNLYSSYIIYVGSTLFFVFFTINMKSSRGNNN